REHRGPHIHGSGAGGKERGAPWQKARSIHAYVMLIQLAQSVVAAVWRPSVEPRMITQATAHFLNCWTKKSAIMWLTDSNRRVRTRMHGGVAGGGGGGAAPRPTYSGYWRR